MELPESVKARLEASPLVDLVLRVLRDALPDVQLGTLIPAEPRLWPRRRGLFVLVRRYASRGVFSGQDRFLETGGIQVHVFAHGPDAEQRCELVSEAVRVVLRDAVLAGRYYPGLGCVTRVWLDDEPLAEADWATASGPVQYADLPSGWRRFETRFQVTARRPLLD